MGHPPRALPVHLQQDVSTPAKHNVEVGSKRRTRCEIATPRRPQRKRGKKRPKKGYIPYPAIIIRRRPLNDRADKKGLIAVDLLPTSHDAEAQAARSAPPQDDVFAAVEVPAGAEQDN